VATLALAALASAWAAPARADVAQVSVVSPGGAERTLALEALAGGEDVVERAYAVRSSSGTATETVTGFSLAALIEAAGADPYSFSYLEVQRPGGGSVILSRDQALDEGAFPDGPPVVHAGAGGTAFLRPSAGTGDLNAGDCFEAPQGIRIVLAKGQPLRVRAKATPLRTPPGEKVSFEAIVERAGAGSSLSYSWYFDDGHSAIGRHATHSFAKRGSYDVVVGVRAAGHETGASAVVTIEVGAPLAGPDRKGGGHNGAKGAPDHGAADGASGGQPTGSPTAPTDSGASAPPARFESSARRNKGTTRSGVRVEGEVLGAGSIGAANASPQVAARRGSLRTDGDGGGFSVPTAAWGTLATLALLGTGAALEAGSAAAIRRRLRGRAA